MLSRRSVVAGLGSAPLIIPAAACRSAAPAPAEERARLRAVPGCEGCEAVWERAPSSLPARLELASARDSGDPLLVNGTVFQADGRTPAPNVILYVHHTNAEGRYANGTGESEWSRRHGRLRGWLRTRANGTYSITTIKPAPYPGRNNPAHIHMFVLDPRKPDPYWIDDVVFDGEFGVYEQYRTARLNQGGPGIVKLTSRPDGMLHARRDIRLLA